MTTRSEIRTLVRGAYDIQKLRIQMGNRVVGNFRAKLGQEPGAPTEDMDDEAKALLADLKVRYRRLADAMPKRPKPAAGFQGDEVISTFTDFALVAQYVETERVETEHFKRIERVLDDMPIYRDFLSGVRGIGPAMAGVIVSEFDIHLAKYPSSLWAYAGLDVAPDGYGRSKRKEHLVEREYVDRDGKPAVRDSITYNPWLRTKLLGVLGPSFLRSASPYADHYRNYRHRIETDPARVMIDKPKRTEGNEWSKQRRHQAAIRYMIKQFLTELYNRWRAIEGLPIAPTYHEAKQGHVHRAA